MRLNGWQRLWLVTSGLILVVSLGAALREMPTKQDKTAFWQRAVELEAPAPPLNSEIYATCMKRLGATVGDITKGQRCAEEATVPRSPAGQERYEQIQRNLDESLAALPEVQRNYVLGALLLWAVLSAGLYAVGWLIAWIARGFRKAEAT